MSNSSFVSQIFRDSHSLAFTFVGHNFMFGYSYLQNDLYTDQVLNVVKIIRSICYAFGPVSPFEELIDFHVLNIILLHHFLFLLVCAFIGM